MQTNDAQKLLRPILDQVKRETFVKEYQDKATDAEALGILTSKFFEWDGLEVLAASYSGLEDSNFHREAAVVDRMIKGEFKYPLSRNQITGRTFSGFGYSVEFVRVCGRLSVVAFSKGPRTLWRIEKGDK